MLTLTLGEIAEHIGGVIHNRDASLPISGVKPLDEASESDIAVITKRLHVPKLEQVPAAAGVVPDNAAQIRKPVIRVSDPRLALAKLLHLFYGRPRKITGIDRRAIVAEHVAIGEDVNIAGGAFVAGGVCIGDRVDIYPGVYLGEDVRIGDDSVIFANVSVYANTIIGKRVQVHSGAVIGSDGFGYTPGPAGELCKIPQVGHVEIDDDVDIGANTTIDRSTMTRTVIGRGTKIDNLVQIGHNVRIATDVCIVAQAGVSGSVRIEKQATLAAGSGIADHLIVGEGARIGARAGVHRNVPPGVTVIGTPAIPGHEFVRAYPLIPQLPEYRRKLKALEERCCRLEAEFEKVQKQGCR